ncbi:glycosyltransferase [Flavobacterium sp. 3-218]
MIFAIITHAIHSNKNGHFFSYAPYVREMNIWNKYADQVIITAPISTSKEPEIELVYEHSNIKFIEISNFNILTSRAKIQAFFKIPKNAYEIYKVMRKADHIHLRCPGNVGLLGCLIQIFFPSKKKTAKYAGNWDPESKQPFTYKLQKWILSNTFLTRNMQVLVYGEWEKQSKNVKPFFTATYSESEKETLPKKSINLDATFIFVGSLVSGKNPLYAIKLIENLAKNGENVTLHIFGEGIERGNLEVYIKNNQLESFVFLYGNQNKETVKQFYKKSHFVILPSKSEGWPKAIAEGMFWGCLPITTNISCLPFMVDYGKRGILLEMKLEKDLIKVKDILSDENLFTIKSRLAEEWSQNFTIDRFESEIEKLLIK